MNTNIRVWWRAFGAACITAVIAAGCGGGGGTGPSAPGLPPAAGAPTPKATSTPTSGPTALPTSVPTLVPTSAPTSLPTFVPTPAPTVTPPPQISGVATIGGVPLADGTVVYSCSCTGQAGTVQTDAQGNFTIAPVATAIPAAPSPTYTTVPGRNYVIVAKAPAGAETWTMEFLGTTAAHNVGLGSGNAFSMDLYATAASLYVYFASPLTGNKNHSYDQWNLNSVQHWAQYLRMTAAASLSPAERQLLSDIAFDQQRNYTLFPSMPAWYPSAPATANGIIRADLQSVQSTAGVNPADPVPTPCPGGVGNCLGAPAP